MISPLDDEDGAPAGIGETQISPKGGASVSRMISPETIYVSPLSRVQATIADASVSHLVTLINLDTPVPTPSTITPDRHLRLAMNDISEPLAGLVLPCGEHVETLVRFALDWDRKAPLLIHCWAGISRSTAAAFISLCALNPEADEFDLARILRDASATAYPNRKLVSLGDQVLSRSGRMVEAVEEIGRGELAEEGRVFSLPARYAA